MYYEGEEVWDVMLNQVSVTFTNMPMCLITYCTCVRVCARMHVCTHARTHAYMHVCMCV